MKTSTTHNQYVFANNVLIFIVSMLLGYNIYQEIYHPEKSHLFLCAILVALTSAAARKYGMPKEQRTKYKE
ncbi:MAG TPA: hypothetical protein DIT10_10815 [Chryseobacterium sp.]|nr:hypothetical protein [Chryseobacterium sp.]